MHEQQSNFRMGDNRLISTALVLARREATPQQRFEMLRTIVKFRRTASEAYKSTSSSNLQRRIDRGKCSLDLIHQIAQVRSNGNSAASTNY